jgi:hypothetical protein
MNSDIDNASDLFSSLANIVELHIGDLLYSVGQINDKLQVICENLKTVIKILIDHPQSFDLSEKSCLQFLTSTFPKLVEVILKRNTKM